MSPSVSFMNLFRFFPARSMFSSRRFFSAGTFDLVFYEHSEKNWNIKIRKKISFERHKFWKIDFSYIFFIVDNAFVVFPSNEIDDVQWKHENR